MRKEEAILRYKASMTVFKKWRTDGLITAEELSHIDTILSEKYGLSLCSIYREDSLLYIGSRANMQHEGGAYEKVNNKN